MKTVDLLRQELKSLRAESEETSERFKVQREESKVPMSPDWESANEWNRSLNQQIHKLDDKFQNIEKEAAEMRVKIGKIINQKDSLTAERDDLAQKLSLAQAEKDKLLVELASISFSPRSRSTSLVNSSVTSIASTLAPPSSPDLNQNTQPHVS
jgi:chromosome segregation ATPase